MKKNFLERKMNRFYLSEKVKNKYRCIIDYLAAARQISKEERTMRAKDLLFIAHVYPQQKKNKLILGRDKVILNPCGMAIVSIPKNENIMQIVDVKCKQNLPENWQISKRIKVYVPADVDGNPQLTIEDVAAQLPKDCVDVVKGFALQLKDDFFINGYNHLLDAYEYNVCLYK